MGTVVVGLKSVIVFMHVLALGKNDLFSPHTSNTILGDKPYPSNGSSSSHVTNFKIWPRLIVPLLPPAVIIKKIQLLK